MKLKEEYKDFHKRSHFYSSKIASSFFFVGDDYEELPLTILINIFEFSLLEGENYHSKFIKWDEISKKQTLRDLEETHFIELPKIRKKVRKGNIDLNDKNVRLILLLDKKTPQKLIQKVIKMDKYMNKIYEKALHIFKNQDDYLAYIRAEQAVLDHKTQLKYAKDEGRNEEKIEIAIKLKKSDFPLKEIAEITGMSEEKIKQL